MSGYYEIYWDKKASHKKWFKNITSILNINEAFRRMEIDTNWNERGRHGYIFSVVERETVFDSLPPP